MQNESENYMPYILAIQLLRKGAAMHKSKMPCRTSAQIGHQYVLWILNGYDRVSLEQFQMKKHVFISLCELMKEKNLLCDSRT